MKITTPASFLSISIYTAFAYFFWILKNPALAALIFIGFTLLTFIIRSMRNGASLLLAVGLTHFILWSLNYIPYLKWPVDFYLVTLIGFAFLKYVLKQNPEKRLNWSFHFTKLQWGSIAIINLPSIAILFWYYSNHKSLAQQWPIPQLPLWSIPVVILLIAAINGLREEIFYRGFLQKISEETFPSWFVVAFQAIFFGSLHFMNAFPQGWLGVCLTAIWGAAIAVQYHIFRSIALAWLTHSIADAVMFGIILAVR